MPSHLTKKIFPSFHQHEKDEDDDASIMSRSSSITLVNPDDSFSIRSSSPPHAKVPKYVLSGLSSEEKAAVPQATDAIDKTYPEDAIAPSHPDDLSDNKTTDPGPSLAEPCVKICPHENLSFERLQRILNLEGFQSSNRGIDAIGATKEMHHTKSIGSWTSWTCCPNGASTDPEGTFNLKYNRHHSIRNGWKTVGLELRATWKMGYHGSGITQTNIDEFLKKLENVTLCPHKKLDDPWIRQRIHRNALPKVSSDPVDQWEAKQSSNPVYGKEKQDCDHCGAHFVVSGWSILEVKVRRCLGQGVSADDPAWLAQCGV